MMASISLRGDSRLRLGMVCAPKIRLGMVLVPRETTATTTSPMPERAQLLTDLKDRLEELTEDGKKISQAEIARDCTFDPNTVNAWFNGKSLPSSENLAQLADYLKVSCDYLLGLPVRIPAGMVVFDDQLLDAITDDSNSLAKIENRMMNNQPSAFDVWFKPRSGSGHVTLISETDAEDAADSILDAARERLGEVVRAWETRHKPR